MPIQWQCPGFPKCLKVYTYAQALRGHMESCKHANKKRVRHKRAEVETMLAIIQFVEEQQKGNVTLARQNVTHYKKDHGPFAEQWRL